MSRPLELEGLSINGPQNREIIYGYLTEAQIKFAIAARATAQPQNSDEQGVQAGSTIFHATYDALSFNKWEGRLPTTFEITDTGPSEQVLPYPVILAMAYFLDMDQTVCLKSWNFHTGNPDIDRAIVSWPNSILWGIPAKMRFIHDLYDAYDGSPTTTPLLSNSRTRAVQLLTIGKELLNRQIKKIDKPNFFL